MATIGQKLAAPEAGWLRFDNADSHIKYNDSWVVTSANHYSATLGSSYTFVFSGTKFRIIHVGNGYTGTNTVSINGTVTGTFIAEYYGVNSSDDGVLAYEKTGLVNQRHTVTVTNSGGGNLYIGLGAIDTDGALETVGDVLLSAPTNLTATAGDSQVTLSWTAVSDATGYNIKRSTTAGGPYTNVGSNVSGTSYVDSSVTNGTTYYYVVTALNGTAESANSNEASATPVASPVSTGNELLRVTMNDSSEREYHLTTTEINGFINWVTCHISTGPNCYMLNKIEVLQNSKEYLMFEKIISFEVIPLMK
jgi:hypothetical protein